MHQTKQTYRGNDIMGSGDHTIFYSSQDTHKLETRFVVLRYLVSKFTPVNERLYILRIRGKLLNISLICAHTNIRGRGRNQRFYKQLENIYDNLSKYDVKILLGDMNAKIEREGPLDQLLGHIVCMNYLTMALGL